MKAPNCFVSDWELMGSDGLWKKLSEGLISGLNNKVSYLKNFVGVQR